MSIDPGGNGQSAPTPAPDPSGALAGMDPKTQQLLAMMVKQNPALLEKTTYDRLARGLRKHAGGQTGATHKSSSRYRPYDPDRKRPADARRAHKYDEGTYGDRKAETKRVSELYGTAVSGDTHEHEHAVGYASAAGPTTDDSGTRKDNRAVENSMLEYLEWKPRHRDNIGTGNKNDVDGSGFNSSSYRHDQNTALHEGGLGDAIALNQLTYAHQDGFQGSAADTTDAMHQDIADDSYHQMVENAYRLGTTHQYTEPAAGATPSAPFGGTTRAMTDDERIELHLTRDAARTGQWPDVEGEATRYRYPKPTQEDYDGLEDLEKQNGMFEHKPRTPGSGPGATSG